MSPPTTLTFTPSSGSSNRSWTIPGHRARQPRPIPARPGDQPHDRDRSGQDICSRGRLLATLGSSGRSRGASRVRRASPAKLGAHRVGLAASGAKARSTKPQARIDAAKRLLAQRPESPRGATIEFGLEAPRLGNTVIKAHPTWASLRPENVVLRDVDIDLGPGDRVGSSARTDSGKSTFVKLLAGRLEPTTGTVKTGPTVVLSYLDQGSGDFDLDATAKNWWPDLRESPVHSKTWRS